MAKALVTIAYIDSYIYGSKQALNLGHPPLKGHF